MYFTKRTPFEKENFGTKIVTDQITFYVNNVCNTKCDYCAIDKQQRLLKSEKNHLEEMNIEDFKKIFSMNGIEGIKSILFQGKEPTLWKSLQEAINFSKENGKETIVFTNGIKKVDISPDILILHIDDNTYATDIDYWKKLSIANGFHLTLVFVIGVNSDIKKYMQLIIKYSDSYVILPESPILFNLKDKLIVKKIFFLLRQLFSLGYTNYMFEHPIPYCLIDKEDMKFIDDNNIKFGGTCQAPKSIILNYDLKYSFPCIMLPNIEKIDEGENLLEHYKKHLDFSHNLRNTMPKEECYKCDYYINKYCQGGCLINRFK